MKALLVASSSTMRAVLRRILFMRGFEVEEADNGRQTWEVLQGMCRVDLVLVDWILNQVDSLEFIARLRRETAHETIVILLVTAAPGVRELHRALMAGADDFLIKPFTSQQFDEKLHRLGLLGHPQSVLKEDTLLADRD